MTLPPITIKGRVELDPNPYETALDRPVAKQNDSTPTEVRLDGQKPGKTLKLSHADIGRKLTITGTPGRELVVSVDNDQFYATHLLTIPQNGKLEIAFGEIMQYIPIGQKVEVSFYDGNKTVLAFRAQRLVADFLPDPNKLEREITPFYQEVAADLRAGKPLVMEAHVVLWDWTFTGAGKGSSWANGRKPETNLYWGAGYGLYTMLKKDKQWELVKDEPRQAVFRRAIKPSGQWKNLGVTEPFTAYVVLDMHYANEIVGGYRAFAEDLVGSEPEPIALPDGSMIEAGGQSRVIGLIGHLDLDGGRVVKQTVSAPPAQKKAVFMTTCLSAQQFADSVVTDNVYPLLFNTQYIAPEGYTFLPLFQGVAEGRSAKEILNAARSGYQHYHQDVAIPANFFVNAARGLTKYLYVYEGDSDGDQVQDRIDPEPFHKNKSEWAGKRLIIYPSTGERIEINTSPY
ncbi:MAG: hypothetical protein WC529_08275 [Candidatus Margulisiibacteriota bacterium]